MNLQDITDIKLKLINNHFGGSPQNLNTNEVNAISKGILSSSNNTIWKLLLELFAYFLLNYYDGQRIRIRPLQIRKHFNMVKQILKLYNTIGDVSIS